MNLKFLRIRRLLAGGLLVSMMTTLILLIAQGRWKEAVPLHLCSISAFLALALALRPRAWMLDALFYAGMPGAALALLFPAPAASAFQLAMNVSYTITHAMILIIPGTMMLAGMRPRAGRTPQMLLLLLTAAMAAQGANQLLGTDFFFLSAPAAGTPLIWLYRCGYPAYLLALVMMMLLACMAMDAAAQRWERAQRRGKKEKKE